MQHHRIAIYGKSVLCAAVAACLLAGSSAVAQPVGSPPADPAGEWLVAKQVARIRIVNCNDRLWGVVSWEARNGGTDSKNPDTRLRNRPTLGMPILLGMTRTKPNQWDGDIYNSEDGRTYSANISLANPDTLKVQGCVLGFLCGGENWTRFTAPAPNPQPSLPAQAGRKSSGNQTAKDRQPSPQPGGPPGNQTETDNDICLRLVGPPRLAH